MPVKGIKEARQKLKSVITEISGEKSEKAVVSALIVGGGAALLMAPIATGDLVNSLFRSVKKNGDTVTGEVGFSVLYAAAVHDAPGTLKGTNTPRHPATDGNVWDPDAEPGFLVKGFEQHKDDIDRVVKRAMKL